MEQIKQGAYDAFEKSVQDASPETLARIGAFMKNKETWAGLFTLVFGAWISSVAFDNDQAVSNIMDNGLTNPDDIKSVLLCMKIIASSVVAIGTAELVASINDVVRRTSE